MNTTDWIPITSLLPDNNTSFLGIDEDGDYHICHRRHNRKKEFEVNYYGQDLEELVKITHWQPLPKKPMVC